jgi:hypothetical protein
MECFDVFSEELVQHFGFTGEDIPIAVEDGQELSVFDEIDLLKQRVRAL